MRPSPIATRLRPGDLRIATRAPAVLAVALLLASPLTGCVGEPVAPARLGLSDPLAILDELVGPVQLLVFDASRGSCGADGRLSPNLPDAPDATFSDAVVDLEFEVGTGAEVRVPPGEYLVLVRGRGTDPVSGVGPDALIASGCAEGAIVGSGETRQITIELKQIVRPGLCGDGILSPDEQCESGSPAPCLDCRTQSFVVNTTTQASLPALGFADGAPALISYDVGAGATNVRMMLLDVQGQLITSPTALAIDELVDVSMPIPGVQSGSAAASSPARVAVAFGDYRDASTAGGDVLIRFFDDRRSPLGDATRVTAGQAGAQTAPTIALMPDGSALVAFEDSASSTGISARHFAAGATTGSGSAEAPLAEGHPSASTPALAAHGGGFVLAFASAGDIFLQRIDANGSARAPEAALDPADAAGEQAAPSLALLADGRLLVAWLEATTGAIRARAFAADGSAQGPPFAVSMAAGNSAPSVAASRERFVIAYRRGLELRARLLDGAGAPALNREQPPSADEFVVASGVDAAVVAAGGAPAQGRALFVWASGADVHGRLLPIP
ncbi:MAG: hypothetical protein OEY14_13565 [Myxococcales bacterium]|nr:hypothetical protein [Myxococcales bacterium]